MSEMVERVAKAMQQRAKEPVGNIESLERVLVGSLGDAWPYLARAALEAMRNPSDEICTAGIETGAVDNDDFYIKPDDIRKVVNAMISAALK